MVYFVIFLETRRLLRSWGAGAARASQAGSGREGARRGAGGPLSVVELVVEVVER